MSLLSVSSKRCDWFLDGYGSAPMYLTRINLIHLIENDNEIGMAYSMNWNSPCILLGQKHTIEGFISKILTSICLFMRFISLHLHEGVQCLEGINIRSNLYIFELVFYHHPPPLPHPHISPPCGNWVKVENFLLQKKVTYNMVQIMNCITYLYTYELPNRTCKKHSRSKSKLTTNQLL